jgi:AcrR family transcriptional regulator
LAAAADIISEHGVDGMTLADVGVAAGYSRGLPAHYYRTKTKLLEAVATYIIDGFANRLAETSSFKPGLDALLGSVENYLTITPQGRNRAIALQTLLAESLSEVALRSAVVQLNERSLRRLASTIKTGIANGEIRPDVDAERQAMIILGTLRSLVAMWLIDSRSIDLESTRKALVSCLKDALAV